MGSSSYLSTLDTVIIFLRVWGRTVTRKNGNNSDNFFNSILQEYYIEVLHVIYQKKLEKILYKLKLTLTLLFLWEKCITLLIKGKIWSGHSIRAFLGMYEPVFP
jgi:hypothetical protein